MLTDPTMRRLIAEARIQELRRSARRSAEARPPTAERSAARPPLTAELRWLRWLRAR